MHMLLITLLISPYFSTKQCSKPPKSPILQQKVSFYTPMENVSQLWTTTCDIIKNQISEVKYQTIIAVLSPSHIDHNNNFYLIVPHDYYKETVEKQFAKTITDALYQVTNKDYNLRLLGKDEKIQENSPNDEDGGDTSTLVTKYTFDSFVKAKSNDLAYATAMAVAEKPGDTSYNPLFLYGGVGLGKTHLMHSIGNFIKDNNPNAKIIYCSTETFMNEMIGSIKANNNESFRKKYRASDVLLIDDIQFLAGKDSTQEEFFHTFNVLRDANKQIVITSDKPPKELETLEERLISRFGQGITVDLKLPELEARIAILEKKAQQDKITIPKDVNMFIAENFYSNIRDLEGALNKVIAYAKILKNPINIELATTALGDMLQEKDRPTVNVNYIQEIVASYFDITADAIRSKKRTKNITHPRHISMYLCRKLLDTPLVEIGKSFGGRDHSTVIHGCEKITELIDSEQTLSVDKRELTNTVNRLEQQITGKKED